MKTQIFEYKGFIGIVAGDQFVNDPYDSGQIGFLVNISEIEITQSALDELKKVKKVGNSLADLMCYKTNERARFFGWVGGNQIIFMAQEVYGDRDYTPSLLESQVVNIDSPEDFKKFIDDIVAAA